MSGSRAVTGEKPHAAPQQGQATAAVMGTYARQDIVFARGEGCWLVSATGDRYLDFGSGVAVNALGHAHPRLVAALTAQAEKLWHTSNLYRVEGQETVDAAGERIFRLMLETASGRATKSETHGYGQNEFVPWQLGAVM